ncbi:MAG TPA: hypothetical protein VFW03_17415 [Gemmatimonadaceae bacterium]|nr:hypothetical protein [Gemmatimonadaceae bacterium]
MSFLDSLALARNDKAAWNDFMRAHIVLSDESHDSSATTIEDVMAGSVNE